MFQTAVVRKRAPSRGFR